MFKVGSPFARRSWPLWAAFVIFSTASLSFVAWHYTHQPTPPRNLIELSERLKVCHPEWKFIPMAYEHDEKNQLISDRPMSLEAGFWVCDHDVSLAEVGVLHYHEGDSRFWRGIVECRRVQGKIDISGDPAMIEKVSQVALH